MRAKQGAGVKPMTLKRMRVIGARTVACESSQIVNSQHEKAISYKPATRLSPRQLHHLADRMAALNDPAEAARLKEERERGLYGELARA